MNRRRMLHVFKTEFGEYEDAAVLPAETDPQIYLSRNTLPQPFHLICSKDNVLSQLSGAAHVFLRNSSVNRFRMDVGDHVYIPAGTPHRIVPLAPGVTLRYQPLDAGLQGAAWYCAGCDAELRRYEWEHDNDTPAVECYTAACQRFSDDVLARTCDTCGTVAAGLDLAPFGWSLVTVLWPGLVCLLSKPSAT
jgi:mannose-6-phosphate isomerase-like protein (cupin superfamily)